ncbi:MAG: NTP transferase domain-containing protein [Candidatus Omnitrophica bacterium]|nr:NTP transferase domain-containing protein [Candidatus Omnitrophota bacterium]
MKAILLAAGVGRRMGPNAPPKCLLRFEEKSLLQMILESLRSSGVEEAALVVGYRKEEILSEAKAHQGSLRLSVVENPQFQEGAILSLWSARDHLNEDVLIMDTDVLCPPAAIERLVRSSEESAILVDGASRDTGEEQMVFGEGERALQITKRPSEEIRSRMTCFGEAVGFLKLEKEAARLLAGLLQEKVGRGIVGIEHEQVYPELFRKKNVGVVRMEGLAWMEIDTPHDLRAALEGVLPRWSPPLCANRVVSRFFLPWVLKLPVTPNQWTFLSLLLGLGAIGLIAHGGHREGLWGALFFQLFYILDNWDGEVARARGLSSRFGGWLDVLTDGVVHVALAPALAMGLQRQGASPWVIFLGGMAAFGVAMDFLVTCWAKVRGFGPAIFGDPGRGTFHAGPSPFKRRLQANLTHENFSLLVLSVLLLNGRLPFLAALGVGTQVFWLRYLWRERRQLFSRYSFAQARR